MGRRRNDAPVEGIPGTPGIPKLQRPVRTILLAAAIGAAGLMRDFAGAQPEGQRVELVEDGDFESLCAGTRPDGFLPAGAWFVDTNAGLVGTPYPVPGVVSTESDPAVWAIVPADSVVTGSPGKCLRLTTTSVIARAHCQLNRTVTQTAGGTVRAEFDWAAPTPGVEGGLFRLFSGQPNLTYSVNGAFSSFGEGGPYLRFRADGKVVARTRAGIGTPTSETVLADFTPGVWYHIRMEVDLTLGVFAVYGNQRGQPELLWGQGLNFYHVISNSPIVSLNLVLLGPLVSSGVLNDGAFDNISVSVPAP